MPWDSRRPGAGTRSPSPLDEESHSLCCYRNIPQWLSWAGDPWVRGEGCPRPPHVRYPGSAPKRHSWCLGDNVQNNVGSSIRVTAFSARNMENEGKMSPASARGIQTRRTRHGDSECSGWKTSPVSPALRGFGRGFTVGRSDSHGSCLSMGALVGNPPPESLCS